MTETQNLATALAAFQAEMPVVHKGNRADVPTKSGGKYSYTYADLADVTEAAMPILTRHGLSFIACPRQTERGYELTGTLLHTSGEEKTGALPIAGNSPQEMGSSITYMRRYLLGCMTGIVTDDDDDGAGAQQAPTRRAAKKATPPPADEIPPRTDSGGHTVDVAAGPMSQKTRGHMFVLFDELKITDEDEQRAGISKLLGREVASRGSLTEGEARVVIKSLEGRKNTREDQTA